MLAVGTLNAPPRSPSILPTNAPSLSLSISLVITVSLLKRITGLCATPHKSVDRPNSVIRPIYHRSRISQGTSPGLERQTTGRWRRFFVDLSMLRRMSAEDADLPALVSNPHGEEARQRRLRTMRSLSSGAHSRDPLASPGEP